MAATGLKNVGTGPCLPLRASLVHTPTDYKHLRRPAAGPLGEERRPILV